MALLSILGSMSSLLISQSINASPNYGTHRKYEGGTSYAYAWTGSSGNTCAVRMNLVDVFDYRESTGWAQTKQLSYGRDRMATSNHWVNGSYIGYSQD